MISRFIASAERLELLLPVPCGPLGILDASFNPPTIAHLELAALLRAQQPDCCIVLMLSTGNADKPAAPLAQLEHRLEMIMAFSKCVQGPVSVALTKEPYFIDKARALHTQFPDCCQVFAMGSDTLVRLYDPKYYKVPVEMVMQELYGFAKILVVERPEDAASGVSSADLAPFQNQIESGKIIVAQTNRAHNISSSRARSSSSSSSDLLKLVPEPIAKYIEAHNLYKTRYTYR